MKTATMPDNVTQAMLIGGVSLVRFFDDIQIEQRKRWSCPDWRTQPITEADLVNWRDVSAALAKQRMG